MMDQDNKKVVSAKSIVCESIKDLELKRETLPEGVDVISNINIPIDRVYTNNHLDYMECSNSKILTERSNNSVLILDPEELKNLFRGRQIETERQNNISIKTIRTSMNYNIEKNQNIKNFEKKCKYVEVINKNLNKQHIPTPNPNISPTSKNLEDIYITTDNGEKLQNDNIQNKNDLISNNQILNPIQTNPEQINTPQTVTRRFSARSFPRKFPKNFFQNYVPVRTSSFFNSIKIIGPKISINSFEMNHSRDSVEQELDLSKIEKMFDKENNNSESKDELGSSQEQVMSHKKREFHPKRKNNQDEDYNTSQSKFSIKINNSKNQFEIPARLDIIYTQTSNNHCSNTPKKKSCLPFICSGNQARSSSKKRNSKSINTSMYSVGNNITHTKRSTNLSIKSMKLNDSLSKLRKRRSTLNSNNEETVINGEKESACRCLVF
jgi:hypothetical protein